MKNKIILLSAILSFLLLGLAQAFGSQEEYFLARDFVKSGDQEFALMNFLAIAQENPNSKYRQQALFAVAEYYFLASDYNDSFEALREFIRDYPDSEMMPYALIYLWKISQGWGKDNLAKNIENQIKNLKRVVLLFKETREGNFKSPLGLNHKIIYYIDRLEFYLDGKLQAQFYY